MNKEDQNLTAYALGELIGKEKENFEKELTGNPELQAEVDAIREFTGDIEAEFKMEEEFSLEGSQRDKIIKESKFYEPQKEKKAPVKMIGFALSAAAALAVGFIFLPDFGRTRMKAKTELQKPEEYKVEKERKAQQPVAAIEKIPGANNQAVTYNFNDYDQADIQSEEKKDFINKSSVKLPEQFAEEVVKNAEIETGKALNGVRYKKKEYATKGLEFSNNISSTNSLRNEVRKLPRISTPSFKPVEGNTERYGQYVENKFGLVKESPLTTFSIDVDTASYTNIRKKIMNGYLPHKDAVRIEEMINYFDYDYSQPEVGRPFSVNTEVAQSPWSEGNKLVRIGLQGKEVKVDKRPSSNLVFLIDVSGSMSSSDKLPLLKEGFQKMVSQLNEKDRVGIVVYAGNAGVVLDPTVCDKRGKDLIIGALGRLNSGGSTNGAGGINQAYKLVQKNFIPGGTNRVILATDGDFNVGVSHDQGLIGLVKEKAKEKAYLTVLGFGQGNLNDRMMEEISNKGNGNYFYIDSAKESTKVLCEKISSTLVTIAKDVKIQIEFNPSLVHSYRLIGYDNRKLKNEDFNNDKKDAGEIGAGHNVTAIYEIVPAGSANARPKIDDLKYQPKKVTEPVKEANNEFSDELLTVKLRYKSPEGGASVLMKHPVKNESTKFSDASKDFIFASSVASFGMLLKNSEYAGAASYGNIENWITSNNTIKSNEDREELLNLVRLVKRMKDGE